MHTQFSVQDELCLAIRDIKPQAPTHVLLIPRKVISTHADITAADSELIGYLHVVAVKLAQQLKLEDRYRIVINYKDGGRQVVPHLHFHLLCGRSFAWPPG